MGAGGDDVHKVACVEVGDMVASLMEAEDQNLSLKTMEVQKTPA